MDKTLIILASSLVPSRLEKAIKTRYDCLSLWGIPKALMPISGRPALSWWYDAVKHAFKNIYMVTNAHNYKSYERWASGHDFPRANVLNAGFSAGALSDIAFVHRVKSCDTDVLVMLPEFLYDPEHDGWIVDEELKKGWHGNKIVCFRAGTGTRALLYGLSLDAVVSLDANLPPSSCCAPMSRAAMEKELANYVLSQPGAETVLIQATPSMADYMMDSVDFEQYERDFAKAFDHHHRNGGGGKRDPIRVKAYARVGLMGNPSDGFYGKTMSLLISNFWAEVTLLPHPADEPEYSSVAILANPVADPRRFSTLASLASTCTTDGYENGDRLLLACCKVFYCYCQEHQIALDTRQGFRVMFETNIPRQVGLAGSSAIITAFWKALMQFYDVSDKIPIEKQASLVLSVEQDELAIAAGLQDRVIQVYGGLVYMDFDKSFMEAHGHGRYEPLDPTLVPPLFLAYVANPEDSGKVHSTVKQRFLNGDPEVLAAMQEFARLTDEARKCLEQGDHHGFANLVSANFALRRKVYGDAVVGARNLRMVELAQQHHCVAKFPGSGGAIIGLWNGTDDATREQDLLNLRRALEAEGFVYVDIVPQM